jgi:hypothetical protein
MTTSPTRTKQKLSLRKRLFVKKSPKVGCYVDTDSNDEFHQSTSRPISPADPFIAHSAQNTDVSLEHYESQRLSPSENHSNNSSQKSDHGLNDDENNPKCCRTFFRRSRPRSLVEGPPSREETTSKPCSPINISSNSISDHTVSVSQSKSEELPKATVKFPIDDTKKYFEYSGSFEGIKPKNKLFVKRLSADHLITNESKPLYRSSSPESDRSSSLDRKRR